MRLRFNTLGIFVGLFFGIVYGTFAFISGHAGVASVARYQNISTFYPVILATLVLLGLYWRKSNGSKVLTFLEALQYAFIAYVIFELILLVVNITLFNVMDPTLYDKTVLYNLNEKLNFAQTHNAPSDAIKEIQDSIDNTTAHPQKGMSAIQILIGLGQDLVVSFIKAMLVGFVLQKKDANATLSRGNA
jgi:hypothetical protein